MRTGEISRIMSTREVWGGASIKPFILIFTYAGFQSVVIPSLAAASRELLKRVKSRLQQPWHFPS